MKHAFRKLIAIIKRPFETGPHTVVTDMECWMAWFVVGVCHALPFVAETSVEQEDFDDDTWNVYVRCPRWCIPILKHRILCENRLITEIVGDDEF